MNTDYVIRIRTKRGRTWSYRKEHNGWSQTASTGIVRECSADQLLSHLLPPLAGDQPGLSITVKRKGRRPRPVDSSTDFADLRRLPKTKQKKKSA